MKGLRLMASDAVHPAVARKKAAERSGPSSVSAHTKVASTATQSSTVTPAAPMARRLRRSVRVQPSEVSV